MTYFQKRQHANRSSSVGHAKCVKKYQYSNYNKEFKKDFAAACWRDLWRFRHVITRERRERAGPFAERFVRELRALPLVSDIVHPIAAQTKRRERRTRGSKGAYRSNSNELDAARKILKYTLCGDYGYACGKRR